VWRVSYGAPGRDSQAVPSLSPSSWCGSSVGPPAATKNDCAVCQSVKSLQLRSSPKGSNPPTSTGAGVATVVAVGTGELVAVGIGMFLAAILFMKKMGDIAEEKNKTTDIY